MAYIAITNEVILTDQAGQDVTLTGYKTTENTLDDNGNILKTVTTYFDAAVIKVGSKIENFSDNTTDISLRVYADEAALAAQNFKEYGEFSVTDDSDVAIEKEIWEFDYLSGDFNGGTEVLGTADEPQISIDYAADWSVTSAGASIGSGVELGSITDASDTAEEWNALPFEFKGTETTIYKSTDTTTGETQYYSKDDQNNYALVGTKITSTWTDDNDFAASSYNFINTDGEFVGGGGRDFYNGWSDLTDNVPSTSDTTYDGVNYYTQSGSFSNYDDDGILVYTESWSRDYLTSDNSFLGGTETRDGNTFVYDSNWNIISFSNGFNDFRN